jgi:hypothetical protein
MMLLVLACTLLASATAGDCKVDYHGSCPFNGHGSTPSITDVADEATCLTKAEHVRNYCYRTQAHGNGAVTTTWLANGASSTSTANNGCELDYHGSCPNAPASQNKIQWGVADEETCLNKAKWWATHCHKTQAHGNGAVTATWVPNGAVVASSTFAAINGCEIDYHGSCPYNGLTTATNQIQWDVADEATCLAKSAHIANYCYRTKDHGNGAVTTTWIENGTVVATESFTSDTNPCTVSCALTPTSKGGLMVQITHDKTSGHTRHMCFATDSTCACKCCNDSDGTTDCTLKSNFQ